MDGCSGLVLEGNTVGADGSGSALVKLADSEDLAVRGLDFVQPSEVIPEQ